MANKDLRGKLVLITGGARGIGRATAVEFLRHGARVLIADIDLEVAEQTARELASTGEISAYKLDVTQQQSFSDLVERIEREKGPLDVLVNNAGIMSLGPFLEHEESKDRRQIEINLFGVIHGMRAAIPRMKARGHGHIVNVASLAGRSGIPHAAAYTASKFAVIGVTESVRNEMFGTGIDFTYVMPYLVNTELASGTRGLKWPPVVQPEDVARALVDGVERRKLEVYVPRIGRLTAMLPMILPRALTDWIGVQMGLTKIFKKVDESARAAYLARIGGKADGDKDKPKVRVVGN
jgi:NAD(P)-dependent dehydrogenase (short-subunit alcohol dehydrogenase family)